MLRAVVSFLIIIWLLFWVTYYSADEIDFFVCCCITNMKFWVLPFKAVTVITLKIYNGVDSKFHRYEDAWNLLENFAVFARICPQAI